MAKDTDDNLAHRHGWTREAITRLVAPAALPRPPANDVAKAMNAHPECETGKR